MKQKTLAATGYEKHAKATRRAQFLAEMERVVPWAQLCAWLSRFAAPARGVGRLWVANS